MGIWYIPPYGGLRTRGNLTIALVDRQVGQPTILAIRYRSDRLLSELPLFTAFECDVGILLRDKPVRDLRGLIMLVLSRKKSESIVINDDITITIVEVRGDKVRLGINAPRSVPVHRKEVLDAILRGNQKSESSSE